MGDLVLIPKTYRCLSGSGLKILAVLTMLADHIGATFPRSTAAIVLQLGKRRLMLYTVLRFIGRLSFPIFAFLLVEGFLHTHDRERYGIRLAIFALLSELPWNLLHAATWRYGTQNVFFTLLLGYCGLCLAEKIQKENGKNPRTIFLLITVFAVSSVLKADYGSSGFGFILMLYLLREQPLFQAIVGACFLTSRWQAGLAFIPIGLYNGKRGFIQGKVISVLFYAIYPVHMLILYWIKKNTIGY